MEKLAFPDTWSYDSVIYDLADGILNSRWWCIFLEVVLIRQLNWVVYLEVWFSRNHAVVACPCRVALGSGRVELGFNPGTGKFPVPGKQFHSRSRE